MIWVYAISSLAHNYIYVGMTQDLENRIQRHNGGREQTTKPYIPYQLIYKESLPDRTELVKEKNIGNLELEKNNSGKSEVL